MKGKTLLLTVALTAVIGGSWLVYNSLKDQVKSADWEALQSASPPAESPGEQAGEEEEPVKAPDFTVVDGAGNQVKLSDMLGKPIVLNFWASWCPPCKGEMPEFNEVYEEIGADIQFVMVDAVDGGRETMETGSAYIAEQGFTFPVYYDTEQDAVKQYGIRYFPTSLFIDKDGNIVAAVEQAIDKTMLLKGIELISETAEAPQYHKITPEEAKRIMEGDEPFILLDVRTESEFNEKRLEGAVLIPDSEIASRAGDELPDKSALILVYCRSGQRSAKAANDLVDMGYNNVSDLGGIIDWPYETTGN